MLGTVWMEMAAKEDAAIVNQQVRAFKTIWILGGLSN